MHASRAYIASIGSAGVLIASSLLLFAVVGAIVAFNGWPGGGGAGDSGALVVDERVPAQRGPAAIAAAAAPAAAGVAPAPAGAGALGAGSAPGSEGSSAGPGAGGLGDSPTVQSPAPGATSPSPPSTAGEDPPAAAPDAPQNLTDSLADTTEGLTNGVDNGVSPVAPRLGDPVRDTGQVVSDVVRGLGELDQRLGIGRYQGQGPNPDGR